MEGKQKPEVDLEAIEFRELTAAEYIEGLEDDKVKMMIRSQIGPMSFAMKQPNKLSIKKILMLPWGRVNKLMIKFTKSQGMDSDFLVKK